ncbi:MAG TPA: MFS transporter [Gaiellaceae bacterium]|jgi:EmrB/QacA subfamily drug resistance transporter|nr:MFS transporter [Gaiellaceae bacterium]
MWARRPTADPGSQRGQGRALAAVCAVLFLTFLDTTIVSVTLGTVQSDLHAGVTSLQWIVNAYALLFAALMLTGGTLGDRYGRRKLMLGGVGVFAAGSLLGALAPSVGVLIGARALMGVGAAASEPGTLSVLRHVYPEQRARARAYGIWAAVTGLALASGPLVGGALVGAAGWRAVFWFNLAVSLVLVPVTWRLVPESSDPDSARLDLPGLVLGAVAVGALAFAIIGGETAGYTSGRIEGLLLVAVLAGGAFVVVERRSASPMLNLRYFRIPAFSSALLVVFAVYFGIFSIFFFTALYLEEVVGYSGYRAAAEFALMAAALVAGSLLAGRWVARSGPGAPMAYGCLLAAVGILVTEHFLPLHPRFWPLAVSLAIAGFGFGIAIVPVTASVMSLVPPEHSGMAASATNTSRELGAVFGVAVLGALVNAHLTSDLTARLNALGIPANFQSIVIGAVETGKVPSADKAHQSAQSYGPIAQRVIEAAYGAFHRGLDTALVTSAVLILAAGAIGMLAARTEEEGSGTWSPASPGGN